MIWVPVNTRIVMVSGVKSGKDTGHLPVVDVQVELLVDPSGAVTTTVTGVGPGRPVTSTISPVQPIRVQGVGPVTSHPAQKPATHARIVNTRRGIVTGRTLVGVSRVPMAFAFVPGDALSTAVMAGGG
jgi:hypothetical protein